MGRAVNRRVELEMTLIRLCQNAGADTVDSAGIRALQERIAQLESRPVSAAMTAQEAELTRPHKSTVKEPEPEVDIRTLKSSDLEPLPQWGEILEECGRLNPAVAGALGGSTAQFCKNVIFVTAENPFFLTLFKVRENAQSLGDAIEKVTGKRFTLRARCSAQAAKPRTLEELLENAKNSGIPTTAVT
jgi:DNA polymerase-3 subunit gamma/tau